MNYQIVTGSTASISFIEVYGNATPAAAAIGPNYQHFDNTPRRILGRQNYDPFGSGAESAACRFSFSMAN